jgi:hypothetical protein
VKFLSPLETVYLRPHSEAFMRLLDNRLSRLAPSTRLGRSVAVLAVVAAFTSTLTGCPDKASPDPATGKDGGMAAAAGTAPAAKAGASAAAPAKTGGW